MELKVISFPNAKSISLNVDCVDSFDDELAIFIQSFSSILLDD